MSFGEVLVFGDAAVPLLREGVQVKPGDAVKSAKLVFAAHSPIDSCALGANPSSQMALLCGDGGSVEATVFARPPSLPRDEGFQHGQGLEPLNHPCWHLRGYRGAGKQGEFALVEEQRATMVGSECRGRTRGQGRVVGVKLIKGVEGGHTVPVRPHWCARRRSCARHGRNFALRVAKKDSCTRKNHP